MSASGKDWLPFSPHSKSFTGELWQDSGELPYPYNDRILFEIRRVPDQRHPDTADNQERAEQIEAPVDALDQRDAGRDHRGTHDHRTRDSPIQYAMLIRDRNAKVRKNQRDEKEIVQAE